MISNIIKLFKGIVPAVALLGAIILSVSGFAIYESRKLANLTTEIHEHPLAVSNAVRKIQSNINAMHRSMKDVVIAQTPEEFSSAVEQVDVYERESLEAFDLIGDRFLGNLKYVASALKDFKNWKKIRSTVIALKNQGRREEAAEITKGNGFLHIELMNKGTDGKSGLNYLLSFAENKALDFKEMSKQREQRTNQQIVFVFALSIMMVLAAIILFQRNRKSTNELQESEQRFKTIFEQASVGVALIDSNNGQFLRVNMRYGNILGYTKEEMASKTFMGITHSDNLQEDLDNMEKLKAGQIREFSMEKKYHHKDGSVVWVKLFVSPMWAAGQKPNNHVAVIEDITERKEAEKELLEIKSELLHSTRVKTIAELTAALAHELNHPLGSILNNANAARRYLSKKKPDLDELRNIVDDIISEDSRAVEVMQKVRSLMKHSQIELSLLNINMIIEDVLKLTQSDLIIKNILVSKQFEKNLPALKGDRIQLQQVFLNLIINATDSMHESKVRELLISTAKQDGGFVIVCVRDSGTGFDEKDKEELFVPFFTTKKEGMGMGLSVVKTIIKSHGGDVWVENNKKRGASFFVRLKT